MKIKNLDFIIYSLYNEITFFQEVEGYLRNVYILIFKDILYLRLSFFIMYDILALVLYNSKFT